MDTLSLCCLEAAILPSKGKKFQNLETSLINLDTYIR